MARRAWHLLVAVLAVPLLPVLADGRLLVPLHDLLKVRRPAPVHAGRSFPLICVHKGWIRLRSPNRMLIRNPFPTNKYLATVAVADQDPLGSETFCRIWIRILNYVVSPTRIRNFHFWVESH